MTTLQGRQTLTVQMRVPGRDDDDVQDSAHQTALKGVVTNRYVTPFGSSSSQRLRLRKAISGEDTSMRRHDSSARNSGDIDKKIVQEAEQVGLIQQHDSLLDIDYAGPDDYRNKRMILADAMDSIYVNFIVISIVLVDVISIVWYELQEAGQKDCFGRDYPLQEVITLCCLGGYVTELLLRGVGKGWRESYEFKKKNANALFDATIVAGHSCHYERPLSCFSFVPRRLHKLTIDMHAYIQSLSLWEFTRHGQIET